MTVYEVLKKRRTIRGFQDKEVPREVLEKCVNAARLAPNSINMQSLEFIALRDPEKASKMFNLVHFARGFKPEQRPTKEERPRAYIVILKNKEKSGHRTVHDSGIAAMSIVSVAEENKVASCILANIEREKIRDLLDAPKICEIPLVVALGYPAEKSVVEPFKGKTKYWKDSEGVVHVPKRGLEEVLKWDSY